MIEIAIASPSLSQSRSISHFLSSAGYMTVGLIENNRSHLSRRHFQAIDNWQNRNVYSKIIATGAKSTFKLIQERQVLRLGDIELSQNSIRFFDKDWANSLVKKLKIPVPNQIEAHDSELYPVFVKSSNETSSKVRKIVLNKEDLKKYNSSDFLLQEYIEGTSTYGFAFLAKNGQVLTHHQHEELASYPAQGGSAVIIRDSDINEVEEYSRAILKKSKFSGWGLLEYKYDVKSKQMYFMELNPKFWASCEFTFRKQPEFVKLLFNIDVMSSGNFDRMIFIRRAIRRGPEFTLRNSHLMLKKGTRVCTF